VAAIIEKPRDERFLNNALNALNGLRAVGGINIDPVIVTGGKIETQCTYSEYGNASGEFKGIDELMRALDIVETQSLESLRSVAAEIAELDSNSYSQPLLFPIDISELEGVDVFPTCTDQNLGK